MSVGEKGRSFHEDEPKTEKAREPTVESLVGENWTRRVSEAERRLRKYISATPEISSFESQNSRTKK